MYMLYILVNHGHKRRAHPLPCTVSSRSLLVHIKHRSLAFGALVWLENESVCFVARHVSTASSMITEASPCERPLLKLRDSFSWLIGSQRNDGIGVVYLCFISIHFCSFGSRCWLSFVCNLDGPHPKSKIECQIPNSHPGRHSVHKQPPWFHYSPFPSPALPSIDDDAALQPFRFSYKFVPVISISCG